MADAITIKALQDASLDAKSLEEVVNGDEAKQVTTRKGETYPSVKKALIQMFENGGLPATPFATKALMTESLLVDGDYAMVTDDEIAANNGLYVKTTGEWVKSSYDLLTQAKVYIDSSLITTNLFSKKESTGEDFSRLSSATARNRVSNLNDKIVINIDSATSGAELRWRFLASEFANSKIGASLRLVSATASGGATVSSVRAFLWQVRQNGSTITSNNFVIASELAVTEPIDAIFKDIELHSEAAYVEFGLALTNQDARELIVDRLSINKDGFNGFVAKHIDLDNVFFDKNLTGVYASVFNLTTARNVSAEMEGTFISGSSLQQVLYEVPAVGRFGVGSLLRFGADIYADNTTVSTTLIFYNENGVEISRASSDLKITGKYDTVATESIVPAGCAMIAFRLLKSGSTNNAKFKNVFVHSSNQDKAGIVQKSALITLHIDGVNGDDSNSGALNQPLKTFKKAISLASANTKLIVAEGDYFESPQVNKTLQTLEVAAKPNARVRMFGGTKIEGATKTSGFTKVYQVPFTGTNPNKWIYQHGTPDADTLITTAERRKHHKGRTHRLPDFTRIWEVSSIAAIDAAIKPSWFVSEGTLYFSVVGGGSPASLDIYIPSSTISLFYGNGITNNLQLKIVGINAYYYLNGFRPWDMCSLELINCGAYGCKANGLEHSDTGSTIIRGCEFGGNGNDGSGAHQYRSTPYNTQLSYDANDNYYHDNGDDGQSAHERWVGSENNSLFEYNGDRGVATAVGAHTIHSNCEALNNGQGASWGITIDDGAGFAAVGDANDGGVSTDINLYSCISEGNRTNYTASSSNGVATLRAVNCKSLNPVNTHYSSGGAGALMTLVDCSYNGSGAVTSGSGAFSVINSEKIPTP